METREYKSYIKYIWGIIILLILLIGSTTMWILSEIQKRDVERDNLAKKQLIESYEKIIRFENDSTHTFEYMTKDGTPITYQELMDENFMLLNLNDTLRKELSRKNSYLELIKLNYGIKIIEQNDHVWSVGEKVDSALLLLDAYRDKIKYDAQNKVWTVVK